MRGGPDSKFMTDVVSTVKPNSDLFSVADVFLQHNFRRMPVVEGKKLVGQISRRDVLRAIQDSTSYNVDNEEINGYITQEMKGSLSK
jgi:predicted transcriptional regulator